MPLASRLAEKLGLPGNSPESVDNARDKVGRTHTGTGNGSVLLAGARRRGWGCVLPAGCRRLLRGCGLWFGWLGSTG